MWWTWLTEVSGVWRRLRLLGQGFLVVIVALCALVMLVMGVGGLVERDRPVTWGTFTETATDCSSAWAKHRSCTITGRWVSEDGLLTKDTIGLDGSVEPGQSVRAGYQPDGIVGSDEIVHTEGWLRLGPWIGLAMALGTSIYAWYLARRWRALARTSA